MLQRSGTAATLAAAHALAPALFSGCDVSFDLAESKRPIRVGLLHSQTGPMAITETSVRDAELLAIEEINASGGLLGRPIEVFAPDTKSRSEDLFAKRARKLLVEHNVAAVFGCWTSTSRKAVIPLFEEFNRLLFYPLQYEGNESSRNVIYGGAVPNQQILPAIDWLLSDAEGARTKVFLVGSDYVFPRTANLIIRKYLASKGLQPAGEVYRPMGDREFGPVVQEILESGADCVLSTINGDSNLGFYDALAKAGVDTDRVQVVATSLGEGILRNLLPSQVAGHLAAWSYFQSIPGDANRLWVENFRHEFGFDRFTSDPMETAYSLVHLWKKAVEKAGALNADAVRAALRDGVEFAGPGGPLKIDPRTQHAPKYFRLGRIRRDRTFEIIHQSDNLISPDPYPQIAFPGWSCDWTKDGVTRGPEVSLGG